MFNSNTQYREITISQLPDTCSMKVRLLYWVKDIDRVTINVAARKNITGEWSAYIGYPALDNIQDSLKSNPLVQYHCANINHKKDVLAYGDLLDEVTAKELFPEWKDKKYST